ncbi:hypothetical protein [Nocardia gipuzkoensis]
MIRSRIVALLTGNALPQAQSESDTPDLSVSVQITDMLSLTHGFGSPHDGSSYTDIPVGERIVRVGRLLEPTAVPDEVATAGKVSAPLRVSEATTARGVFLWMAA